MDSLLRLDNYQPRWLEPKWQESWAERSWYDVSPESVLTIAVKDPWGDRASLAMSAVRACVVSDAWVRYTCMRGESTQLLIEGAVGERAKTIIRLGLRPFKPSVEPGDVRISIPIGPIQGWDERELAWTEMVQAFGADTLRLFLLSDVLPQRPIVWQDQAIEGRYRFLRWLWTLVLEQKGRIELDCPEPLFDRLSADEQVLMSKLYQQVGRATRGLDSGYRFNLVISAVHVLAKELAGLSKRDEVIQETVRSHLVRSILLLLAPITPHLSEALWEKLGGQGSIHRQNWLCPEGEGWIPPCVEVVIQVNGKRQASIRVEPGLPEQELIQKALNTERVCRRLQENRLVRTVIVPNRLINLVIGKNEG